MLLYYMALCAHMSKRKLGTLTGGLGGYITILANPGDESALGYIFTPRFVGGFW